MNGAQKFHPPSGPAFSPGEIWKAADGSGTTCEIVTTVPFGQGKWDWEVEYRYPDGSTSYKDAWNFQVRYYHIADENLKIKSS